jgi:hypothetical protein
MYITLEEIATLVRTLELLSPTSYLEAESFYEDDRAANDNLLPDPDLPRYY